MTDRPYKALQSKALHKGSFIGYVIAHDHQYTTNGHFMVAKVVTAEEVPPLKEQQDKRVDGSAMPDVSYMIEQINGNQIPIASADIEQWTNEAGLELTRATSTRNDMVVSVQSVYIDYLNALFDDLMWYMTPSAVFCTNGLNQIVGVIAKVKEESNDTK